MKYFFSIYLLSHSHERHALCRRSQIKLIFISCLTRHDGAILCGFPEGITIKLTFKYSFLTVIQINRELNIFTRVVFIWT